MTRRNLILLIILGLVALIGIFIVAYQLSLKKVDISFDNSDGTTLQLYSRKGTKEPLEKQGGIIHTFKASETVSLQSGYYVIETHGENIAQELVALTVGDTPVQQTIPINYSSAYLGQLLQTDQPVIAAAIAAQYAGVQDLYAIQPGKLYGKGEWYGTALTFRGTARDNRDTLHIVLRKTDNAWKVVAKPNITLSIVENKDVPDYILRDINTYLPIPSTAPPAPTPDYVINDGSRGAQ